MLLFHHMYLYTHIWHLSKCHICFAKRKKKKKLLQDIFFYQFNFMIKDNTDSTCKGDSLGLNQEKNQQTPCRYEIVVDKLNL